jgi:phage-related protein
LRQKGSGKIQNTANSLESSVVEPVGSGLNKIKSPVSEGVNNVLFDAEMVRLKGSGKIQNTANSLESSVVEPIGSGLNKIKSPVSEGVNNVLFDAEMVRLKGAGKIQNTANSLESSVVEPVGSGLNKIKSPVSEGVNNVLFDAEMVRLKGAGKIQNTASSLESSLKNKVNPLKDSLKENIDNSVFDLELKRLEGQQKAKTQFSNFLKDERANAEVKPALEIKELIKAEIKEGSGIKPAPMILPFVHTTPSQNITPFEGVNIGITERSIQMPSGMEDIEPIQSISNRQTQRPIQKETAEITAKATGIEELMEIPVLEIPNSKYNKNRSNKKAKPARLGSGKEKNLFNKYGDPLQIPDIGRLF